MTTKQLPGIQAPDGSTYSCITDGAGNLATEPVLITGGLKQVSGNRAPDGSMYRVLTDGAGNLFTGGGGGYVAKAVHFDGSIMATGNDNLNADAYTGLASFWVKVGMIPPTNNTGIVEGFIQTTGNDNFGTLNWTDNFSPNTICSWYYDISNTNSVDVDSIAGANLSIGSWMHIINSFNLDFSAGSYVEQWAVNGVVVSNSEGPITQGPGPLLVNYNDTFSLFTYGTPLLSYIGDMADAYFAAGQPFFDLTVSANLAKFISAGKPVDLGVDGSNPTGSQPNIFLSGDATGFLTNRGTNAALTWIGTLTNASTSPSD